MENVKSSQLFIAKLYSVMDIKKYNTNVIESIKLAKVRSCYVLVVKEKNKFYIIPNSKFPRQMEAVDYRKANKLHQLVIQADSFDKCKPLTYYAPYANDKLESSKNLRVYSEFIANNFVEGRKHEDRRKLNNLVRYCHNKLDTKDNSSEHISNNSFENSL